MNRTPPEVKTARPDDLILWVCWRGENYGDFDVIQPEAFKDANRKALHEVLDALLDKHLARHKGPST